MGNCFGTRPSQSDSHDQYLRGTNAASASHGSVESRSRGDSTVQVEAANSAIATKEEGKADANARGYDVKVFTYSDLKEATQNFRRASFLGQGGFGRVFKGWIDEKTYKPVAPGLGRQIAVKLMNHDGLQGDKEWMTEVFYLSQLRHPHLVKLIGYCSEADQRLLAYEFMPNGSLEDHLFVGSSSRPLSWEKRLKVAIGAARGLAFLHTLEPCVIYRDFKSSNILLDSDFNPKLSDFGLAKDGPIEGATHVTTRVMGTFGYAAPEYIATGHLTPKNDVYGFGVVLLEILTGRKAVDNRRRGEEQNLVQWAMPFLRDKSKVLRLVETRLEGQYSRKGALMLAHVAYRCVNPNAKERPSMQQVVELLEPTVERSYKDMANSPRTRDGAHQHQDRTLQSAQEALDSARSSRDHRRN